MLNSFRALPFIALLLILIAYFFSALIFEGQILVHGDNLDFGIPVFELHHDMLFQGKSFFLVR